MTKQLFTVGHSNRAIDEFVALLEENGISAVADVRSHPYSRRMPHFNFEVLSTTLQAANIAYVFLGAELGARREEACCYVDGRVQYALVEQTDAFLSGIERVRQGCEKHRIALMCAEKDPLTCHRAILIAKHLRREMDIRHILDPSVVESHGQAERRLLREFDLDHRDLFQGTEELIDHAYSRRAEELAYERPVDVEITTE